MPRPVPRASQVMFACRRKAVYVAVANRTFLLRGNLTDGGLPGPATGCTSTSGQDPEKMYSASALMAFIFAGQLGDGRESGCVGDGGLWPFEIRTTKVGRAIHAVYGAVDGERASMPGREWPVQLVVCCCQACIVRGTA